MDDRRMWVRRRRGMLASIALLITCVAFGAQMAPTVRAGAAPTAAPTVQLDVAPEPHTPGHFVVAIAAVTDGSGAAVTSGSVTFTTHQQGSVSCGATPIVSYGPVALDWHGHARILLRPASMDRCGADVIAADFDGNATLPPSSAPPWIAEACQGCGWVNQLYVDLLSRSADTAGQTYWSQQRVGGVAPGEITSAFVSADEHRVYEVRRAYEDVLRREPDAGGSSFWSAALPSLGEEQLDVLLAGSDEYLDGRTTSAFVDGLYRDFLGRSSDPGGLVYYSALLAHGISRGDVAGQLIRSNEGRVHRLNEVYELLLGRAIDSSGATYWTAQLDRVFVDTIRAELEASPEAGGS